MTLTALPDVVPLEGPGVAVDLSPMPSADWLQNSAAHAKPTIGGLVARPSSAEPRTRTTPWEKARCAEWFSHRAQAGRAR